MNRRNGTRPAMRSLAACAALIALAGCAGLEVEPARADAYSSDICNDCATGGLFSGEDGLLTLVGAEPDFASLDGDPSATDGSIEARLLAAERRAARAEARAQRAERTAEAALRQRRPAWKDIPVPVPDANQQYQLRHSAQPTEYDQVTPRFGSYSVE